MVDEGPDGRIIWFDPDQGASDEDGETKQAVAAGLEPGRRAPLRERRRAAHPAAVQPRARPQPDDRIESLGAAGGVPFRVLSRHGRISSQPVVIQVARSEAPMRQELQQLALILVLGLPLGVAIAGFGGYSLARRALAPMNRMAERARLITAERLSDRLPVDHPDDELGRLATVFNETLGAARRRRSSRCAASPPMSRTSCGRR